MRTPPPPLHPWTRAEDVALREAYPRGGIAAACAALPARTKCAIFRRVQRIGIATRRRRWTHAEDRRLRMLWGERRSLRSVAKELGRSPLTTYWRAQKIGLDLGCPQGFEYLSAAATRTGYATSQLRAILLAAGVHLRRCLSRNLAVRGRLTHYVDPLDVDDAVVAWLATEPLEAAARARGISAERLRTMLGHAGIVGPVQTGRHHWRIPSNVIEAAVAAFAKLESLADASARVGISRETLSIWLRAEGFMRFNAKAGRYRPGDVDVAVQRHRRRAA